MKYSRLYIPVLLLGLFLSVLPVSAHAACSDPVGAEGQMTYNTTHKAIQFCDGTNWYTTKDGGGNSPFDAANCADGDGATYNASSQQFECAPAPTDGNFDSVVLLTHFDSDFSDSSASNHTLTANGNATISTAQKKFGAGSSYFDGTSDYLSLAGSSDFAFGTGDFTVEMFIKTSDASTDPQGFSRRIFMIDGPTGNSNANFQIVVDPTGPIRLWSNTSSLDTLGTEQIADGNWHHIAVTRGSGIVRLWVDGVSDGSQSWAENINLNSSAPRPYIGSYVTSNGGDFSGYIDDIRITKGVARYNANFTVPTNVFPDDSPTPATDADYEDVVLLLNAEEMTNNATNFTDKSVSDHTMTANGNAKATFGAKKFGDASMAFDGTGDYITTPDSDDFDLSSGDWTIEMWIKLNSMTGNQASQCQIGQYQDNNNRWNICYTTSGGYNKFGVSITVGGTAYISADSGAAQSITAGQWYHLAAVRSGNDVVFYLNGVAQRTMTPTFPNLSGNLNIGTNYGNSVYYDMNGNIDDLRFTKGVARYTANFTPPAQELPYEEDGGGGGGTCTGGSQTFTSSGTFTPPDGCTSFRVVAVGGGGGGGGGHYGYGASGGGGGSGYVKVGTYTVSSPATVTVGAAGSGGSGAGNNGGTGGTSSFGSHLSASGGTGGYNGYYSGNGQIVCAGGAGGSGGGAGSWNTGTNGAGGSGGTSGANSTCSSPALDSYGHPGTSANGGTGAGFDSYASITEVTITNGSGGSGGVGDYRGGGGGGGVIVGGAGTSLAQAGASAPGNPGQGYGAGGGGASNSAAGGNGAPGIVYVEWDSSGGGGGGGGGGGPTTTNSASSYWTGGASSGSSYFTHSGSTITHLGCNCSMYANHAFNGDFSYTLTIGNAAADNYGQMGVVLASQAGSFGSSHLNSALASLTSWQVEFYGGAIYASGSNVGTSSTNPGEAQTVTITRTSGTFTLQVNGATTYTWAQTSTAPVYIAIGGHDNSGTKTFTNVQWTE